jgi:hypothetical protein
MPSFAAERASRQAHGLRCAGLLTLACALGGVLAGCGSTAGRGDSASPAGSTGATASAPAPSGSPCPTDSAALPDGTWVGPLTATVTSAAPETTARGTGAGELQLRVDGGKVTGGTWALAWKSRGTSTAHEAQSTVRLHGQVSGTVSGTAARPVLEATWGIVGRASVTTPVIATAAVDEAGRSRATMRLRAIGCEAVSGQAAVSMRGPEAYASSDGTLDWAGRRTG